LGLDTTGGIVKSNTPSTSSLPIGSITTTNTNYIPYSNGSVETESSNLQFDGNNLLLNYAAATIQFPAGWHNIMTNGDSTTTTLVLQSGSDLAGNPSLHLYNHLYTTLGNTIAYLADTHNFNSLNGISTFGAFNSSGLTLPYTSSGISFTNNSAHTISSANTLTLSTTANNNQIILQPNGYGSVQINNGGSGSTVTFEDYVSGLTQGSANVIRLGKDNNTLCGNLAYTHSQYDPSLRSLDISCGTAKVACFYDGNVHITTPLVTYSTASAGVYYSDNSIHSVTTIGGNASGYSISSGSTLLNGASIQMYSSSHASYASIMDHYGIRFNFRSQDGNTPFLSINSYGLYPTYTVVNPSHQVVIDGTGLMGVLSKDEEDKRTKLFNTADERLEKHTKKIEELELKLKFMEISMAKYISEANTRIKNLESKSTMPNYFSN
jgi:hypothetical protein